MHHQAVLILVKHYGFLQYQCAYGTCSGIQACRLGSTASLVVRLIGLWLVVASLKAAQVPAQWLLVHDTCLSRALWNHPPTSSPFNFFFLSCSLLIGRLDSMA